VWSQKAAEAIGRFASANDLPVFTTFRRQDYVANDHPTYGGFLGVGMPASAIKRAKESDLILAVGTRLGDVVTDGYAMFDLPRPKQKLVHIHPAPDEIGAVWQADLPIVASPIAAAEALAQLPPVAGRARWAAWTKSAHADYVAEHAAKPTPGAIDLTAIVKHLSDTLPADAIITNGAGNYATWAHRFFYKLPHPARPHQRLDGLRPARRRRRQGAAPDRQVVCFAGDGCFMMTVQELATAVQYGAADRGDRVQQRHLRHDPHAPGAALSRPRLGHRHGEPGLRRLGARLRRPWRDGEEDRGVRPGLPARRRQRQGRDHRPEGRSRGAHHPRDPQRDPRPGLEEAGGAVAPSSARRRLMPASRDQAGT
jgi:hypothetical protein